MCPIFKPHIFYKYNLINMVTQGTRFTANRHILRFIFIYEAQKWRIGAPNNGLIHFEKYVNILGF